MPCPSSLVYGAANLSRPYVSVAIPAYRRPRLLREAVRSALSQASSPSYEVVVVDDDPEPGILDVVRNFPVDRLIVYQNPKNLGLWGNMNRCLELSRGEWVLFLHNDDLLLPGALEAFTRLISLNRSGQVGCLVGGIQLLREVTVRQFNPRTWWTQFPVAFSSAAGNDSRVTQLTTDIRFRHIPSFCSSFFRREALVAQGGWDGRCGGYADVAAFLRMQSCGQLFACREVFGCVRLHDDQLSRPEKLWESYPIAGAHHLLADYVQEERESGKGIRTMVEKGYTSALWRLPMEKEVRRKRAEELLRWIVRDSRRRFLLRSVRLLGVLAWVFSRVHPALGRLPRLPFGRPRPPERVRGGVSIAKSNEFAGLSELG
jgi:glycosyltransferase involved in cell wall biosynthesis